MDTDSFISHIQIEDVYEDITDDVEKNDISLLRGTNKKVIGLMKDELGGKIMTEFVAFISKTYSYLRMMVQVIKKQKGHKNV